MPGEIDIFLAEKNIGKEFSTRAKKNLLNSIRRKLKKGKTGNALKTSVRPVYKNGMLYSLVITTPYYVYPILHMGFEGTKSNGVNQRLRAMNILTDAVENGRLVEDLANQIGELRASQIATRVSFAFGNVQPSNIRS